MKYAAILVCMFAGTAVAGVTSGKLEHVDTKNKIISVDGETFHYDENTKNRTKDWKPKQGDTIVLSWFSKVDDDFQDIKYVKSFRRDQPKLAARNLPADVQVVDNGPQPVQPEPVQPEPVQPPEVLKSWRKAEALKKQYVGKRVTMYVYDMKLKDSWVHLLPWVTVEKEYGWGIKGSVIDKNQADQYSGLTFMTETHEFVQMGFFHVGTGFAETVTDVIIADLDAPKGEKQWIKIEGTIMELNSNNYIGLMIDSMKIQ